MKWYPNKQTDAGVKRAFSRALKSPICNAMHSSSPLWQSDEASLGLVEECCQMKKIEHTITKETSDIQEQLSKHSKQKARSQTVD